MQNRHRYDYFGGAPGRNSVTEENVTFPLKLLWKATGIYGPFVNIYLSEFCVLVVSRTKTRDEVAQTKISAYSREDGTLCWEFSSDYEVGTWICLYDDMVLSTEWSMNSPQKSVIAIRDGAIIWRTEGLNQIRSMCHFDGEIILAAIDGIYFLSPETGEVLRHYEMGRTGSLSFNEDVVVAAEEGTNFLKCFERKSGKLIWNTDFGKLGEYKSFMGLERGSILCRSPLIIDDRLYSAANGRAICFDLNSGELLWMTAAESLKEGVYRNGNLFFSERRNFCRVESQSGEILQKNIFNEEFSASHLPYMAGKHLFCTGRGLAAIDSGTGEMVWSYFDKRKTVGFTGQPIFLNGRLYAADTNGSVYCFGSE